MKQKVYEHLLNHAFNKYTFFRIKYLFNSDYNITYYPTIKSVEIADIKVNIYNRYYENVNQTLISNFSAYLINLLLLTKVYYESRNK